MDKVRDMLIEIAFLLFPGFVEKIYKFFNKSYTVKTVYPNSKFDWVFHRDLKKAKEIKRISLGGAHFFVAHAEIIRKRLENGCSIKLLICGNEEHLRQNDVVVGSSDIESSKKTVALFYSEIERLLILPSTDPERIKNQIEIRYYDLEFRNPVTIIKDSEDNNYGYSSLSLIPAPHTEAPLIRFKKNRCDLAETYFDTLWKLHEKDKIKLVTK